MKWDNDELHFYKEWEEEQMGVEFTKEKNFTWDKRKSC